MKYKKIIYIMKISSEVWNCLNFWFSTLELSSTEHSYSLLSLHHSIQLKNKNSNHDSLNISNSNSDFTNGQQKRLRRTNSNSHLYRDLLAKSISSSTPTLRRSNSLYVRIYSVAIAKWIINLRMNFHYRIGVKWLFTKNRYLLFQCGI